MGTAEPWLLDSREVARLLGISRTKAFQMMAGEELPVVRVGRCVRVPRTELQIWIADRTAIPSPRDRYTTGKSNVRWGASPD